MSETLDSVKITMTLPGVVAKALDLEGKPMGMSGQEYLKIKTISAYMQAEGVTMNLQKVAVDPLPGHPELALGGAGVAP